MKTSKRTHHGWPEVVLGGILWTFLLVTLLAVITIPQLGGWPGWLTLK